MHHRTIQENGTRELTIPMLVWAIDGDFIPLNTLAGAAIRLWLRSVSLDDAS